MKRIISVLMSCVFAVCLFSFPVYAIDPGDNIVSPSNDDERSLEIIELVDPYIVVVNNSLQVNLPSSVRDQINDLEFDQVNYSLQQVNNALNAGIVAVTDNGTIYVPGDNELTVQGGNVNKAIIYWWGIRRYASKNSASEFALMFQNCSSVAAGVGTIALALVGSGGAISLATGILAVFNSVRYSMIANSITYVNGLTNRGIILDLRWFVTYRVVSQ